MSEKGFSLISGTEDGVHWSYRISIHSNGTFRGKGVFSIVKGRGKWNKMKDSLRAKDRLWVYRNIPSSIHWHTEIHHNWANNGTMYLLTKGEHILKHRRERDEKPRKG